MKIERINTCDQLISCLNATGGLRIVQAPPGHGKTLSIINFIKNKKLKRHLSKVLILSFMNTTIREIRSRIDKIKKEFPSPPIIQTIDSLVYQWMKEFTSYGINSVNEQKKEFNYFKKLAFDKRVIAFLKKFREKNFTPRRGVIVNEFERFVSRKLRSYKVIIIDECQDIEGIRLALLHKLLTFKKEFILFYDEYQYIYDWRLKEQLEDETIKKFLLKYFNINNNAKFDLHFSKYLTTSYFPPRYINPEESQNSKPAFEDYRLGVDVNLFELESDDLRTLDSNLKEFKKIFRANSSNFKLINSLTKDFKSTSTPSNYKTNALICKNYLQLLLFVNELKSTIAQKQEDLKIEINRSHNQKLFPKYFCDFLGIFEANKISREEFIEELTHSTSYTLENLSNLWNKFKGLESLNGSKDDNNLNIDLIGTKNQYSELMHAENESHKQYTLCTVHKSKGRQFDSVKYCSKHKKIKPPIDDRPSNFNYWYVALTRSIHKFSWTSWRTDVINKYDYNKYKRYVAKDKSRIQIKPEDFDIYSIIPVNSIQNDNFTIIQKEFRTGSIKKYFELTAEFNAILSNWVIKCKILDKKNSNKTFNLGFFNKKFTNLLKHLIGYNQGINQINLSEFYIYEIVSIKILPTDKYTLKNYFYYSIIPFGLAKIEGLENR